MAVHDADLIERSRSLVEKPDGPMAADGLVDRFALFGLKRAAALDHIDQELRSEIESSLHSLRRHVRLVALRRRMGGVRQALLKPDDDGSDDGDN